MLVPISILVLIVGCSEFPVQKFTVNDESQFRFMCIALGGIYSIIFGQRGSVTPTTVPVIRDNNMTSKEKQQFSTMNKRLTCDDVVGVCFCSSYVPVQVFPVL